MLFRFSFSIGSCCFWAHRDFNLTFEAFSFHFKCLFRRLLSLLEQDTPSRYCAAVPDPLAQYRAALDSSYQSHSLRPQSNEPHSPGLGQNRRSRSFGGDRVRKLAAVRRRSDARCQNHGLAPRDYTVLMRLALVRPRIPTWPRRYCPYAMPLPH